MRDVLRAPGALSLFIASCVARLPMGALGLLLVLHTQELTGSYAKGGLASGAYAIALGLSNPALARVVDRRGQTLVMRVGAPSAAAAIIVLAVLPDGAPLGAILAAAAVAGAAQPPVGACMRALWPVLLDGPDRRHAAYAMEGALLEVVYICGPLVIVAGIGSWSTRVAMAACAVFLLVGDLAFAANPVSRTWRPRAGITRDLTGALRGPGVRVLIAVFVLCGLSVGAVEVAVPAALDATGHRELPGVMLGLWGVGCGDRRADVGRSAPPSTPSAADRHVAASGLGPGPRAIGICREPAVLGLMLVVVAGLERADVRLGERDARRPRSGGHHHRGVHVDLDRDGDRHRRRRGSRRCGGRRVLTGHRHGGPRRGRGARRRGGPRDRERAPARRRAGARLSTGRGPTRSYTRPPPAAVVPWPSHLRRWRNW